MLTDRFGEDVYHGNRSGTRSIDVIGDGVVVTERWSWHPATFCSSPLRRNGTAAAGIARWRSNAAAIQRPGSVSRTLQRGGHRSSRSCRQGWSICLLLCTLNNHRVADELHARVRSRTCGSMRTAPAVSTWRERRRRRSRRRRRRCNACTWAPWPAPRHRRRWTPNHRGVTPSSRCTSASSGSLQLRSYPLPSINPMSYSSSTELFSKVQRTVL